jgi:hypothetical protein
MLENGISVLVYTMEGLQVQGPAKKSATRDLVAEKACTRTRTEVQKVMRENMYAIMVRCDPDGDHQGAMYRRRDKNYSVALESALFCKIIIDLQRRGCTVRLTKEDFRHHLYK